MRLLPVLMILAVSLIVLIGGVLIVGAMLPKRHVASRSAFYRANPEQLFALIAGPQDWRPDVRSSEVVCTAGGRELLRETDRHGQTIDYEIVHKTPPRSLGRRIATPNLPYSGAWTYSLEPSGDGTKVTITEDGEVYNPLYRFVSRFVLGHTSAIDAYLRALGKTTGQDVAIED